jgi:hypothetical protein
VVCLDCGKQFSYDPKQMRIGRAIEPNGGGAVATRPPALSPAAKLKRALVAAVPAAILFLMALFRLKRNPSK